jgi:Zn-dependent membrane protease YugP
MLFTGGAFWTYFLFVGLPVMALSFLASNWVKRTYARYSRVPNSSGLSGADVAQRLLAANGLQGVRIGLVDGDLTDNYDPRTRTLNLSRAVAAGRSVAAEAVVAHEIGHALQDATAYTPMRLRAGLVPAANLGSQAGPLIVLGGLILSWFTRGSGIGLAIAEVGLLLFAAVVLFQLVTTPVELNASQRALALLTAGQVIHPDEAEGARRMLRAAAFTYWVALLASILTLLYYASLVLGGRRNN